MNLFILMVFGLIGWLGWIELVHEVGVYDVCRDISCGEVENYNIWFENLFEIYLYYLFIKEI